jgi:hypothetical protein
MLYKVYNKIHIQDENEIIITDLYDFIGFSILTILNSYP